jgi:uncharacterized membrane protein YgcG
MNKFSRALRHLCTTRYSGKKAFPCATLTAIQQAIADGESLHRAEIRLIVEPSLELSEIFAGVSSRQRAHELFSQYRIWDTEENAGILIYIELADHQVEIVADRGIASLIPNHYWHAICKTMTEGFAQGKYHDSVLQGLQQLNAVLQEHFPEQDRQANQLSNKPILL